MRDLSIRGAGNLLGAQQHGFIDAVGFDMYSQMLSESVARKQGKNTQAEKTTVEIDLGIDAYLPTSYIEDERQKLKFINASVNWILKKRWMSCRMICLIALENIRSKWLTY